MQRIDNLADEAKQLTKIVLEDGSVLELNFRYQAAVERWVLDVKHDTFELKNLGLVLHPNLLRTWRNLIDFGLSVAAADGVDPAYQQDFSAGRVQVYVLTEADVLEVERMIAES